MNKLIIALVIALFLVAIGPLITIWALNTLFPALAIPYSFDTWLAVVIIAGVLKTSVKVSK